ncbi:MAG: DUF418 domain-containing protein [Colwellia sp.]|nr:DUF418 domain-containing protein [Colwellia sp.]
MTQNLAEPMALQSRLLNIDIIRGIALLGILLMNIQAFSMNFSAYSNPTSFGDLSGINFYVYYFSHIFADQKFMTIFSILFGVGIVLMAENIERKGGNPGKIHYKRMFILAIFGLLHAYLLWFGDILFPYALAGMIAYTARKKSVRFLLITAFLSIGFCSLVMYLISFAIPMMEEADLQNMLAMWAPTQEMIDKDILVNQASWLGQMEHRNFMASKMQTNVLFYMFRIVGLMMIGMALFKLDFFGKRFSNKSLAISAVITLALGLLLSITGNQANFDSGWGLDSMMSGIQPNYWGSILMAYSYMSLLIVFCRSSALMKLKSLFANVGKMALTNYLSHTLICGFIFYGWGLGYYGSFERSDMLLVVLGVWTFQLFFSSFWMARYQFGPFEWLWRSMTYGKRQPLKITQ